MGSVIYDAKSELGGARHVYKRVKSRIVCSSALRCAKEEFCDKLERLQYMDDLRAVLADACRMLPPEAPSFTLDPVVFFGFIHESESAPDITLGSAANLTL